MKQRSTAPAKLGKWDPKRGRDGIHWYTALDGTRLSGRDAFLRFTADKKRLATDGYSPLTRRQQQQQQPAVTVPTGVKTDPRGLLTHWGVPQPVAECYAETGVKRLYEWQWRALQQRGPLGDGQALVGGNLVYCAPTSGGKTLVSEILMLRMLLVVGKKVLFVLPFVSVVMEKVAYLQRVWAPLNLKIRGYYGAHGAGELSERVDVAVCTIERANSLVNRMISTEVALRGNAGAGSGGGAVGATTDGSAGGGGSGATAGGGVAYVASGCPVSLLGMVVVDELHMVGDPHRGHLLEVMLSKLMLTARDQHQIVGMSATLPNLPTLASWLNAALFVTSFRPVPLVEYVAVNGVIKDKQWNELRKIPVPPPLKLSSASPPTRRDPTLRHGDGSRQLAALCNEVVAGGHSVLVFCATKAWCSSAALSVAKLMQPDDASPRRCPSAAAKRAEVLMSLRESPSGLCPTLRATVPQGVAYHHAGLTVEERQIVEAAFRKGSITVLVATSTLAAGVNLPARRVILRSARIGNTAMDAGRYRQMTGRAGRAGKDELGESILMISPQEQNLARELLQSSIGPVNSCLSLPHTGGLCRALLEVIASGAGRTTAQLHLFARLTLFAQERRDQLAATTTGHPSPQFASAPAGQRKADADIRHTNAATSTAKGNTTLAEEVHRALMYLASHKFICATHAPAAPSFSAQPPNTAAANTASGDSAPARDTKPLNLSAVASSGSHGGAAIAPDAYQPLALRTVNQDPQQCSPGLSTGYRATQLGLAAFFSSLPPPDALHAVRELSRLRQGGVHADCELHLIYHLTPTFHGIEPEWERYLQLYSSLTPELRHVGAAVGVSEQFLASCRYNRPRYRGGSNASDGCAAASSGASKEARRRDASAALHRRFYAALVLHDLVQEYSLSEVSVRYALPRGTLQSLQQNAATFCGMVTCLCHHLHWAQLEVMLDSFQHRLCHGAQPDILPLLRIPDVFPARARALLAQGYSTAEDVACASADDIAAVIRSMLPFRSRADAAVASRQAARDRMCAHVGARIVRQARSMMGGDGRS